MQSLRLTPPVRLGLFALLAAVSTPLGFGQTAPDAQTAPPPPAETPPPAPTSQQVEQQPPSKSETIKLTPFEVQADKDNGYYAPNTLAGTRINSKVEDLGASITVITKQQLLDTAAVDINDIFKYEANTEGTFDYTAQLSSAPTNDQIQSSPQTATRVRGIGTPNMAINNFVMTSRIPVDSYDLESVEISRGPNSTLFGLGNPSGTINLNTLRADPTRDFNTASFRVDSYGGWRSTIDFNRELWRDKVALRVAAVAADKEFERKPSYDDTKRLYVTGTFKPFTKTTIRLTYEHYMENRQTPNSLTPRDDVTEWIADGKPTWNPLTYTATVNGVSTVVTQNSNENGIPGTTGALPAGLFANSTNYTRPSMYIDGGQVQLWEINRLSSSTNPNASIGGNPRMLAGSGSLIQRGDVNGAILYQVPGINNKALYNWTTTNAVAPDWNYDHASLYTAEIEQELIPDMYFRGAWHLEASNSYNRNIVNPPALEIDVNQYLLDGRSNPYFLRPFYQSIEPSIFATPEYNDNLQAELTYDLNFQKLTGKPWTRWLGEHRMLAYYESRHITDSSYRYREAIIDPNHSWLQPPFNTTGLNYTNGASIDRPTYRYYVGPTNALGYTPGYTPPKSGVNGTFNFMYNQPNGTWVSEPALFGAAPYVGNQSRQEVTSRGVVLQSMFWDDRIVFTGGLRRDFNRTRNSNGAVDNTATGVYDYGATDTWLPWTDASGYTRTVSLVVKPLPWLGLFADKADSFVPQPQAINLFGDVLPNTYGHGQDVGGYLSFLQNKLVLRLSFYRNTVINDRNSDSTIGTRILRLEDSSSFSGDPYTLANWANLVATNQLGPTASPSQIAAVVSRLENFPAYLPNVIAQSNAGTPVRGINNTLGTGGELELDYNPSYNLNFKLTGGQTVATNTSLANDVAEYLAERMPYWLSVNDGAGDFWWTSTKYYSTSAQSFYTSSISVPLEIDQALLGKSNPQVKKYTFRGLLNYRFTRGWLNHFSLGGDLRWDDKSVIGYLAGAPDSDGIVRHLDVNKPVYDPARFSGDMFASYSRKLFHDSVGLQVQLNWSNAFETGGLRVTAVNPDGSPYNYRIIDPQQVILTTRFSF